VLFRGSYYQCILALWITRPWGDLNIFLHRWQAVSSMRSWVVTVIEVANTGASGNLMPSSRGTPFSSLSRYLRMVIPSSTSAVCSKHLRLPSCFLQLCPSHSLNHANSHRRFLSCSVQPKPNSHYQLLLDKGLVPIVSCSSSRSCLVAPVLLNLV
jgi:hypothetical protein